MYNHNFINLSNQVFGYWKVLKKDKTDKYGNIAWICQCKCGVVRSVLSKSLRQGVSTSCGKCGKDRDDLFDKKINNFKVLNFEGINNKHHGAMWKIKCLLCGKEVIRSQSNIRNLKSCGCIRKLPYGESAFNSLYGQYKRAATKRNLKFELNEKTFRLLTKKNCYYCDKPPTNVSKGHRRNKNGYVSEYVYNGIDRVNSSKGYEKNNIVTCCGSCNQMKMDLSLKEFKQNIYKIYNNLDLKKEFTNE